MAEKIPIEKICDYLGEDLDSPFCQEIQDYIKENPKCEIYLDSIKRAITYIKTSLREDELTTNVIEQVKTQVAKSLKQLKDNECNDRD